MSRLYFHTPTDEAELGGAEFHWLQYLAESVAESAWDLDRAGTIDRAQHLLSMVEESEDHSYGENYLHVYLREAQADPALIPRLQNALLTALRASGLTLTVHGVKLRTRDVTLNTAILTGSDPIVLATKLSGWGSRHAWIDGPHRAWVADLIEQGLRHGLFHPDMGWEAPFRPGELGRGKGVVPLLRAREDEPVVLSYSGDCSFPNLTIAGWTSRDDADDESEDDLYDRWGTLTEEQQWALAFDGLKAERPWTQITPENFRTTTFAWPVTIYDLVRADRAEYLRSVLTTDSAAEQPQLVRS